MTPEDKQLLLRDLSARLPYGVYISPVDCGKAILIGIKDGGLLLFDTIHKEEYDKPWDIEFVKPYLRLLSSMTEEEKEELYSIGGKYKCVDWVEGNEIQFAYLDLNYDLLLEIIDWLNAHHFDYRGLIEKGLAIKVTEKNNPYGKN